MNVKVNDTVVVLKGGIDTTEKTIKGRTGTVLSVDRKNNTVTVKGVKMVKKHEKARKGAAGLADRRGGGAYLRVQRHGHLPRLQQAHARIPRRRGRQEGAGARRQERLRRVAG